MTRKSSCLPHDLTAQSVTSSMGERQIRRPLSEMQKVERGYKEGHLISLSESRQFYYLSVQHFIFMTRKFLVEEEH